MYSQIVSEFQAPFGQVQDIAFLPGGEEFVSAAEVLRRNSTDKGIMVWDFRTTAIMSNQIYQVKYLSGWGRGNFQLSADKDYNVIPLSGQNQGCGIFKCFRSKMSVQLYSLKG